MFRKAGERVTRNLLHSMANSTLAGSSANCARACYSSENCKVIRFPSSFSNQFVQRAIYIPSSGMCAFDANEKTTDSADCGLQTPELTSLPTPDAALLKCIRCRKSKRLLSTTRSSNSRHSFLLSLSSSFSLVFALGFWIGLSCGFYR